MQQTILVTGGAGYIGSHTCVQLLQAGYQVVVLDNLSNSSEEALNRVQQITGKSLTFIKGDVLDADVLAHIFTDNNIAAVIHFAGLKAVGESNQIPLKYYETNVQGTIKLCQVMAEHDCKNLVFSSSATVYGEPAKVPITEDFPTAATNPYGRSKLMVEEILQDLYRSDNSWNIARLRYFNPIGAHPSGLIGEDPNDIPNNLMPFVAQVAVGKRKQLSIFGNDYPTKDGTGVRDYIHVMDLANGHICALEQLLSGKGIVTYNLGTGVGYSVLDVVNTFERVNNVNVPYEISARRAGDVAAYWADTSKANKELNWRAELNLEDMVRDSWNWQKNKPDGYN